nr:winged helix-turn-helix domain-containing protein [Sutterella wadsworthensis]
MEALLRRAGLSGMTAGASKKLQVGPLVLDPDALSVEREGKSLRLNPTCFRILTVLMRASPRVVSREELESKVWSDGAPISDSLRSNLYLLRQALDKPFNVPMLKTHPGAGWSVCAPDGVKG